MSSAPLTGRATLPRSTTYCIVGVPLWLAPLPSTYVSELVPWLMQPEPELRWKSRAPGLTNDGSEPNTEALRLPAGAPLGSQLFEPLTEPLLMLLLPKQTLLLITADEPLAFG